VSEALEQQTATSEILRVISQSPTDARPVFDMIAERSARLCESFDATIYRRDGDRLRLVGHYGPISVGPIGEFSLPIIGTVAGRAILEGRPVQVADVQIDADEFPEASDFARREGFHTLLSVPLMREGMAIGAIALRRAETKLFTDRQVALLETFADQAVIAIENVRLFTELQTSNRELTTALATQTATSDILRVISSSPTEVQPVFDTIVANAVRLCGAQFGTLIRFDGHFLHLAAHHKLNPAALEFLTAAYPRPLDTHPLFARAIRERRVVQVADVEAEPDLPVTSVTAGRMLGYRAQIVVPIIGEGVPVGTLSLGRVEPGLFAERQIELLKTFADQAVIAIENVRLFTELQEKNQALTTAHAQVSEALEQQTATSEVLKVISRSTFDLEPVLETLVENATKLCDAAAGNIWRFDGEVFRIGAFYGASPEEGKFWQRGELRPGRGSVVGRTALEHQTVHILDVLADPEYQQSEAQRIAGFRTVLGIPMLREGILIGAFSLWRSEVRAFTDKQIDLVKTFADQAVIAIENVRLLTETKEALKQQTATAEILRVISSSPGDIQPVFDAIAANAARLCDAVNGLVIRFDGQLLHLAAHFNVDPERLSAVRQAYPQPPSRGALSGRAILTRAVVHVPDVSKDSEYTLPAATTIGYRSVLAVPMMHEGVACGTILVARTVVAPFSDAHIALIQTFADQAVIAIENVRLFTELQASNRELTTALDTQTATSEILRVISRSQTDVQPVFDAIVASAVRLLRAYAGALTRLAGDQIELAAFTSIDDAGDAALRARFPQSFYSEGEHAQALRDRAPLNIADAQADPRVPEAVHANARVRGYRSLVAVPMLRHDAAVGTIAVSRRDPGGFSDDEIALLKTFADQAVIAIENARLLSELQARTQELTRSVGELRALGEVGQALSSTLDLQTVLRTIVARATELSGTDAGVVYEYDEHREVFVPRATEHLEADIVETMLATPVRKGEGATGRLAEVPQPIQVPDILAAPAESRVRGALVRAGYRALLAIPLVREDHLLGGLTVIRKTTGTFTPEVIELLQTFATQSALAIQNARLFLEIEDKSRQLEVASQHKSEFLANMSHELRTPLNAIIGFSEVLTERMFGELNEKQDEYLKDIYASGQHLLSLINDILDLSKIEAGRMELEPTDFDLPSAIDNALTLVRERAGRRGIMLSRAIDERVGAIRADERKVKQVLLNLLSNALKFTPEGGRIDVRAAVSGAMVEVSVADTGVGIAPEDQEAVFEEFRQVGTADKKVEGTGLGLALSRKFIELHGGRIWVKSQVGQGSTFAFTLPVRPAV
jgi:GAF domain-containing protein